MPALPPVPATLKFKFTFTIGNDTDANVGMYFGYTGAPPTAANLATIASNLFTSAGTHFAPVMGDDTSLTALEITDLSSPTAAQAIHTGSVAGTRGIGWLPAGVAVLINLVITRRYRGGKPRLYFPWGISADLVNPSQWTTSLQTDANTALQLFVNDVFASAVGGITIAPIRNVSYFQGFTAVQNPVTGRWRNVAKLRTGGPVLDPVGTWTINPKPASQRRRNLHTA